MSICASAIRPRPPRRIRPIVWIGRRALAFAGIPGRPMSVPCDTRPAFGPDQPRRDLWLSPGHNWSGTGRSCRFSRCERQSVTQIEADAVEYWHVELDGHDVLLSEGLPTESYLDCGNRAAFANGDAFIEAHPDSGPNTCADACRCSSTGPSSSGRAALIGASSKPVASYMRRGAHILAAETREPSLSQTRLGFVLPARCREISLNSRAFVPAEMDPISHDRAASASASHGCRSTATTLRSTAANARLARAEFDGETFARRWTSGLGAAPAGARLVGVDLAGDASTGDEVSEMTLAFRTLTRPLRPCDEPPDLFCARRHIHMTHAIGRQGVDDGVHHRR